MTAFIFFSDLFRQINHASSVGVRDNRMTMSLYPKRAFLVTEMKWTFRTVTSVSTIVNPT